MTTIDEVLGELWVAPFSPEDEVERVAAEQAHRALAKAISCADHAHDRQHREETAVQDERMLRRRLRSALALGAIETRRGGRRFVAVPAALIAAALIAILLISSAGPTTTPAYALTRHANGTITITINDLATGIPALNARMKALGINETAIPISAGCDSPDGSGHVVMRPDPSYEYSGSITFTLTPRHYRRHPAMPGFQYVFAATRLPNGKYLAFIGALKSPIPTCLPYSSTPSNSLSVLSRP